jgi:hypothetical protein
VTHLTDSYDRAFPLFGDGEAVIPHAGRSGATALARYWRAGEGVLVMGNRERDPNAEAYWKVRMLIEFVKLGVWGILECLRHDNPTKLF